ncbi:MAG TPA: class F sortase [Ktedonobacteraceae bacterium]|jgi:hypothetical protein|nr:class F sortase [Ktedonobacteraceae bacterium]
MKKALFYLGLIVLVVLAVGYYNYANNITSTNSSLTPTEPWQPARLSIPRLHINAPVLSVGKTSSGAMDAPVSQAINSPYWTSVFWYNVGPAPGQPGNAVIAGHVDRVGGDPAIFWTLSALEPGNTLSVITMDKKTLHFVVNRVVSYPANAPSQYVINAVFGPTTAHHLNLITCSGVWTGHGYDQRLVVFTTQTN